MLVKRLAKREILLLLLLGAAATAATLAIVVSRGTERLKLARSSSGQYELRIAKLEQSPLSEVELVSARDRLKGELETTRKRFYRPGEMSPFIFGTQVRKKLASHGISVVRYQVIELKGISSLEFSISGSIGSLVLFLKEVSESEKYWSISSLALTMREGTSTADTAFRIGYEVSDF